MAVSLQKFFADMKSHYYLTIILLLTVLISVKAENITVDGKSRNYLHYAPENLGEGRPLFIFCHGSGQDAAYMLNVQFRDTQNPERKISIENVCDTAKFVIVFPNGINKQWDISGNSDINFVKALIDKMATEYKIDRNRVYLGGFSMGGMFTYHAMNRIPDLIAAFVPVSGYPMGGATADSQVRPLPILHIHGTGDDVCVFSGVQPALNVWIRHNGCPTTAQTIENYHNFRAKMHTWAPGNNGVEVKLLELADKGHWVCKEPQVYTGIEMWNFCKKYSLELKDPQVKITTPTGPLSFVSLGGHSDINPIAITATATDPDGVVTKAALYDNTTLIEEKTSDFEALTFQVQSLDKGTHRLRVVATDDEGRTGEASLIVNVEEPSGNYVFTKVFNTVGSVPEGWLTYDGKEQRIGYSDGYSLGSRVFQFTGEKHDFEWGLYARNVDGRPGEGYARFASDKTSTSLILCRGNYLLLHRLANWNIASFAPVRIAIEKMDGTVVAGETVTPTVNIGNSAANSFSGATLGRFSFDIIETGRYQVSFYTDDRVYGDMVIGQAALGYKGEPSAINEVRSGVSSAQVVYNLSGQRVSKMNKGIFVIDGKKIAMR